MRRWTSWRGAPPATISAVAASISGSSSKASAPRSSSSTCTVRSGRTHLRGRAGWHACAQRRRGRQLCCTAESAGRTSSNAPPLQATPSAGLCTHASSNGEACTNKREGVYKQKGRHAQTNGRVCTKQTVRCVQTKGEACANKQPLRVGGGRGWVGGGAHRAAGGSRQAGRQASHLNSSNSCTSPSQLSIKRYISLPARGTRGGKRMPVEPTASCCYDVWQGSLRRSHCRNAPASLLAGSPACLPSASPDHPERSMPQRRLCVSTPAAVPQHAPATVVRQYPSSSTPACPSGPVGRSP